MKFAISVALVVLLLGMPLGCILAKCQISAPGRPCCPQSRANLQCPYDALDSAKAVPNLAIADVPVLSAAEFVPFVTREWISSPAIVENSSDLCILNRILRI